MLAESLLDQEFYTKATQNHNPTMAAPMIMSSPVKERAVVDIRATVEAHSGIASDLLAIHGISGADTVATLHGLDKATVIKIANKRAFPLSEFPTVRSL